MSTSILRKTDHQIQKAVQDELAWAPDVDDAGIGVAVEDGAVVLSGDVDSYSERVSAVAAAQRVRGVTAVADDLRVHPREWSGTTDADVAGALRRAFEWTAHVPDTIKAQVAGGFVTLTGSAEWDYQRRTAQRIAESTVGVRGVAMSVKLTQRASATDVSKRIKDALARRAALDARDITVRSSGGTVTLSGTVRSWWERRQAGLAAWNSPHVTDVVNNLVVQSS
jgi:osmotically-inducible protein OsmY